MITLASMGLGEEAMLTAETENAINKAETLVLQTGQVPLAKSLSRPFFTLDSFYEEAEDFDDFNAKGAAFLKSLPGEVLFLALGSPKGNALCQQLLAPGVAVLPGVSFAEIALSKAGLFWADDYKTASAQTFLSQNSPPAGNLVITEVDSRLKAEDVALRLLEAWPGEALVWKTSKDGAKQMPLCQMMQEEDWDYSCAILAEKPPLLQKAQLDFEDFLAIVDELRGENGCPWDREQTHASLRQCLLEECYEVIDAIEKNDPFALFDELGDLLLQIVMHARIGWEHGDFCIWDITDSIAKKMIRRHPHIFANVEAETTDAVLKNWEQIKKKEKGQGRVTDSLLDIPAGMSPLMRAAKVQKKAALVGFDWPNKEEVAKKVEEEWGELAHALESQTGVEEEAGDLLFAVVNYLRHLGISAELAMHGATEKFIARFSEMEARAEQSGQDFATLSLAEKDALWEFVKKMKTNG